MNRCDRVLAAIRHEQSDYVPYNFHGSAGVYAALRQHYGFSDNQQLGEFIGNHLVKVAATLMLTPGRKTSRCRVCPVGAL